VSGATGAGLDELRAALQRLVDRLPAPDPDAPARLWVDRVFTVRGSGTVVTGTLGTGRVDVDDVLELRGRPVTVRGIECLGGARTHVEAPARVALNLRGVRLDEIARGDAVLAPKTWHHAALVDARLRVRGGDALPAQQVLHFGTAAVPVRVRVLGSEGDEVLARLQLDRAVPIRAGDRAVLRDPGRQAVAAGVTVLDADPPQLARRGAAAARAAELVGFGADVDPIREIARRGAMQRSQLVELGGRVPADVREIDGWLLDESAWQRWTVEAGPAVEAWAHRDALEPAMPLAALRRALGVPIDAIAAAIAAAAGLPVRDGRVQPSAEPRSLGPAEDALRQLEERLRVDPFAAPLKDELTELGLGRRELAAAERSARVFRLGEHLVLAPSAPAEAARRLAALPQPFTASQAGAALGTSRRVTIPLLELLDAQGTTERLDSDLRRLRPLANPDPLID
jgi:selenocysteine-specific elongation factor